MHNHSHIPEHTHEHAHGHGITLHTECTDGHCRHDHGTEKHEDKQEFFLSVLLLVLSAVLIGLSFLPNLHPALRLSMQIASAVLSGYELLPAAWEGLKARRLDENLLVLISVLAAFIIGEGAEAAVVSLFFRVGESLEDFAVAKSKRAIEKLYDIQANTATLLNPDGSSIVIPAEDVQIGDILLVSPFDKIPVDCEVLEGAGTADASAITGEALPVELTVGSVLHSGTVNGSEMLKIRATAAFYDSAAAKIIRAVEHSASEKGSADKFITKFAKYYTPAVVGLAVLLALIPSLIFGNPAEYIHRALVFLVASCPCALVLSVPLGFFSAVGAASKLGVIVKGGKYIELLSKTEAILFDKTGTLTDGSFEIEKIVPANGCLPEDILSLAARADRYSTHPLAKAIVAAAGETDENGISDFHETPGKGTSVQIDGEAVLCGSASFLKENGVSTGLLPEAQIYVAKNGEAVGCIALCGRLRESAPTAIRELSALSVNPIILLTGDNETAARQLSEKCGISQFRAGLLPEQKTEALQAVRRSGKVTAFVGDGINDAPTLAAADIGVAMGGGSSAAVEIGDAVLMNGDPENIPRVLRLCKSAMRKIRFNIGFALFVKSLVLLLGAFGLAPMWAAVFADVGVSVISVLNSAALLQKRFQ